jgi:hypothetical protein
VCSVTTRAKTKEMDVSLYTCMLVALYSCTRRRKQKKSSRELAHRDRQSDRQTCHPSWASSFWADPNCLANAAVADLRGPQLSALLIKM